MNNFSFRVLNSKLVYSQNFYTGIICDPKTAANTCGSLVVQGKSAI
jgi:hypothetical protein